MAGDLSGVQTRDAFTELLLVDVVRGHHSTGVAGVLRNHENETNLVKAPVPSFELILQDEYKKLIKDKPLKALIGHNRWATIGDLSEANAHPFDFDGLVGAHNGTIDRHTLKDLHQNAMFDTDSQALYSNLNHHGLQDTIDKVTGAWALTWFDKNANTINFLRNDKRPLYYTYSYDHCTLFWASELEMLKWVLSRNRVRVMTEKVAGKEVERWFVVEADMHTSWKVPDGINKKFDGPRLKECKHTFPVYKYEPRNAAGYMGQSAIPFLPRNGGTTGQGSTNQDFRSSGKTTKNSGPFGENKIDTTKFRPPYKDANGLTFGKKAFEALVSNGCVFCEDNTQKWGDFIMPMRDDLTGKKIFLCEECYNEDETRELCTHIMIS